MHFSSNTKTTWIASVLIKMIKFILFLVLCAVEINADTASVEAWVRKASVIEPIPYFSEVMQEFIYELERREWCNMKMIDINKNVNTFIANLNVTGAVMYTNGFVISIQTIDLHAIQGSVSATVANETVFPRATVRGQLIFHDINIGYDVLADLTELGTQRYTGEILCNRISFDFSIVKDLLTQEITVSSSLATITGPHIRMVYRPANRITEVLSRDIASSDNWNGAREWIPNFVTILTEIVNNKIDFPKICFNDC